MCQFIIEKTRSNEIKLANCNFFSMQWKNESKIRD